jgi:hypothetical protein
MGDEYWERLAEELYQMPIAADGFHWKELPLTDLPVLPPGTDLFCLPTLQLTPKGTMRLHTGYSREGLYVDAMMLVIMNPGIHLPHGSFLYNSPRARVYYTCRFFYQGRHQIDYRFSGFLLVANDAAGEIYINDTNKASGAKRVLKGVFRMGLFEEGVFYLNGREIPIRAHKPIPKIVQKAMGEKYYSLFQYHYLTPNENKRDKFPFQLLEGLLEGDEGIFEGG